MREGTPNDNIGRDTDVSSDLYALTLASALTLQFWPRLSDPHRQATSKNDYSVQW